MTNQEKCMQNFYNNFEFYMKKKNKKLGELEKKLNVSKGYISRVRHNRRNISLDMALNIAEYLDTTLSHMLDTEDWIDIEIDELESRLVELKKKKGVIS